MAIFQTSLDAAQLGLANLLNQNTVPNGESSRREFFIVSGVQRIYRAFDFDASNQTASLTSDDSGLVDVSDLNLGPIPIILSVETSNNTFTFSNQVDSPGFSQGDNKYWLVLNEDKEWELHTTEPNTDITLTYGEVADISRDQAVVFSKMVIAKAALIYYRQAQDPEADVSLEEDEFRQEVAEIIDAQNRRRPQQFAQTARDRYRHPLGGQ